MTDSEHEDPGERLRRLLNSEDETMPDLPASEAGQNTPPAPGSTPPLSQPALDRDNMPLPRRVNQVDVDGTRVSPAAYNRPTGRRQAPTRLTRAPQPAPQPLRPPAPPPRTPRFDLNQYLYNVDWRRGMGC